MSVIETVFRLPRDQYEIPATFALPAEPTTRPVPAVLLLHGTASHRDEVGRMFARLARALGDEGIASLRIDFAGCGESNRPQTDFTVSSELADASSAFQWLQRQPEVDATRVFVLGFSQGGMIAILLSEIETEQGPAGIATWSSGVIPAADRTATFEGYFLGHEDPHVTLDLGFGTFTFSREWWDEFRSVDLHAPIAASRAPVLAVAGSADDVVSPRSSITLIGSAGGDDLTLVQIPGANHIFNALACDPTDASDEVIRITVDWVSRRSSEF